MADKDATTLSFGGDVEPILPDGWDDPHFFDGTEEKDELGLADGQGEDILAAVENEDGKPADDTPTTGDSDAGDEPSAEGTDPGTAPDGEPVTDARPSRKLTLKVNHTTEEIDLGTMSDEELTSLFQKGRAFDAMKEAESKRTYREVYQQQIDEGQTEAVARLIAKDAVGGKSYALTDEEEAGASAPSAAPATAPVRDLKAEVDQLRALYPDFKEVPDEVARSVAAGIPLLTAYLAYRDKMSAKTAASLQRENRVLKQNAAAAAKAPVTGVSGGGTSTPKEKSIFEKGFDEGMGW